MCLQINNILTAIKNCSCGVYNTFVMLDAARWPLCLSWAFHVITAESLLNLFCILSLTACLQTG